MRNIYIKKTKKIREDVTTPFSYWKAEIFWKKQVVVKKRKRLVRVAPMLDNPQHGNFSHGDIILLDIFFL